MARGRRARPGGRDVFEESGEILHPCRRSSAAGTGSCEGVPADALEEAVRAVTGLFGTKEIA